MPSAVSEESMSWLERFVVLMCDKTSDITEINETRKQLFAHKGRSLKNTPPTQAAVKQHIRCTEPVINFKAQAPESI